MATLDLTGSTFVYRQPTSLESDSFEGRFAARFDYRYSGYAVVCQETSPGVWSVSDYPGVATTVNGGDNRDPKNNIADADYVFYGGNSYEVTDANLVSALTTAGYI